MQTNLAEFIKGTDDGDTADRILRKCVHCGFCTATCPTYQLLGDELDSPRGRIYLMKQVLEGGDVTERTQKHLDRCLTCRSCETTCPSGVEYGRLLEIGRRVVDERVPRKGRDRWLRKVLSKVIPNRRLFAWLMTAGRIVRPIMPAVLKSKILPTASEARWPDARHKRRMLVLEGCVQPTFAPSINAATARYLDQCGISLVRAPSAGCCGAVGLHTSDHAGGLKAARRNIDAWLPLVDQGVEAIVMTASGCGVVVADYAELLKQDPQYAEKAKRIAELVVDVSAVIAANPPARNDADRQAMHTRFGRRVSFHPPCTLQHGQKTSGVVEQILRDVGYEVTAVRDSHLCCGSAGTYSVLQSELSDQLKSRKINALHENEPDVIATANIGCQTHLASATRIPVVHWIELLSPD